MGFAADGPPVPICVASRPVVGSRTYSLVLGRAGAAQNPYHCWSSRITFGSVPPPGTLKQLMPTENEVLDALRAVIDPDLHRDIVSLGFVKKVSVEGAHVEAVIELTT